MYQSISVLRFQEEFRTLSIVSRDFSRLNVYSVDFIVDNQNLGFLAADDQANIMLYMYQPESRESCGGQKLLRRGDYHVGQKINAMFRIQCGYKDVFRTRGVFHDVKHVNWYATLDGGLGYILPLSEKTYRRLFMLQNVLVTQTPHLCGVNPKAYRTIKTVKKYQMNPTRNVVDGDLVWRYLYLPSNEKMEVAKKIGTRVEEILWDLLDINHLTMLF